MAARDDRPGRGRVVWRAVFVVALVVLVGSLAALGVIAYSYLQGQSKYGEIAREAGLEADDVPGQELSSLHVDWDALLAANPDTVAWLYVPNTAINYPVVRGEDNEHYLTYDFDGDAGWLANYGAIFLDYRNSADMSDQLNFIYGHHMNDGSMFAGLAGLADGARFGECRDVYLLTPAGNFRYRTFSLVHASAYEEIVQAGFSSREERAAYYQDKIDRSEVAVPDAPAAGSIARAVALSTCDGFGVDGRYILYAYLEDTTASGLSGEVGLEMEDGQATGFAFDLTTEEGS